MACIFYKMPYVFFALSERVKKTAENTFKNMAVFFAEWDKNGAMCRVPECKCVERMAERHAAG